MTLTADTVAELTPTEKTELLAAAQAEARKRCAGDPVFYASFVQTRDESDPDAPVKPFPLDKPYVPRLLRDFLREQRSAVAKSRQVLATWTVCVFMTWWARFKPHQHVVFQTQKWDDAVEKVCMAGSQRDGGFAGRCQFIEQHLPAWLQQSLREQEGKLLYPNGSMIEALAGGKDQIRGKTPSLIVLDEAAFLEEARATYTSIAPLVQKGAKLVMVSTPNGGKGSFFWHVWHGVPLDQA